MYTSLTVKGRLLRVDGSDAWIETLQSLTYEQLSRPIFTARSTLDCCRGCVMGSLEFPGKNESDFETEARFVQGSFPLWKLIAFFISNGYRMVHGSSTLEGTDTYLFVKSNGTI